MHRIDEDANVNNLFAEADPVTGALGTRIGAAWMNDVQEELCQFIEAMGIALVKGNRLQLRDAVLALQNRMNTWTATQTIAALLTLSTSDLNLVANGIQHISKGGAGPLRIGTEIDTDLELKRLGAVKLALTAASVRAFVGLRVDGDLAVSGGGVLGNAGIDRLWISSLAGVSTQHGGLRVADVGSPQADADAVNRGWVNGQIATVNGGITAGDAAVTAALNAAKFDSVSPFYTQAAGWTYGSGLQAPRMWSAGTSTAYGRLRIVQFYAVAPSSSPGTTMATLYGNGEGPLGLNYHPISNCRVVGWDETAGSAVLVRINEDGTIKPTPVPVASHTYAFQASWLSYQ